MRELFLYISSYSEGVQIRSVETGFDFGLCTGTMCMNKAGNLTVITRLWDVMSSPVFMLSKANQVLTKALYLTHRHESDIHLLIMNKGISQIV